MIRWQFILIAFLLMVQPTPGFAHSTATALMEVQVRNEQSFFVYWKSPFPQSVARPLIPTQCQSFETSEPNPSKGTAAYRCEGKIAGNTFGVEGLGSVIGNAVLRVELGSGIYVTRVLRSGNSSWQVPDSQSASWYEMLGSFIKLGFNHILSGLDHILFVLALTLMAGSRFKVLLSLASAFTIAHSITLSLVYLRLISISSAVAEANIGLSLVFASTQLLKDKESQQSLGSQFGVVFFFGLIHGMGFASGLAEAGVTDANLWSGILGFNLGVELGQIGLIFAVLGFQYGLSRLMAPLLFVRLASITIGVLGSFWFFQRLAQVGMGT